MAWGQPIFEKLECADKHLLKQANGVHGSSTLRKDKNPSGAEANLEAAVEFATGGR